MFWWPSNLYASTTIEWSFLLVQEISKSEGKFALTFTISYFWMLLLHQPQDICTDILLSDRQLATMKFAELIQAPKRINPFDWKDFMTFILVVFRNLFSLWPLPAPFYISFIWSQHLLTYSKSILFHEFLSATVSFLKLLLVVGSQKCLRALNWMNVHLAMSCCWFREKYASSFSVCFI